MLAGCCNGVCLNPGKGRAVPVFAQRAPVKTKRAAVFCPRCGWRLIDEGRKIGDDYGLVCRMCDHVTLIYTRAEREAKEAT